MDEVMAKEPDEYIDCGYEVSGRHVWYNEKDIASVMDAMRVEIRRLGGNPADIDTPEQPVYLERDIFL